MPILFRINSIELVGTIIRVKNLSKEIIFHFMVFEPYFSFFNWIDILKAYRIQKWGSQRFFQEFHLTLGFKCFQYFSVVNYSLSLYYSIKQFARVVEILDCSDILQTLQFLDIYLSFSNQLN
jgi:hypothetical protein